MTTTSDNGERRYATVTEAARLYRVTPQTIRRHARTGQLPAVTIGRQWRIDLTEAPRPLSTSARGAHPTTQRIR